VRACTTHPGRAADDAESPNMREAPESNTCGSSQPFGSIRVVHAPAGPSRTRRATYRTRQQAQAAAASSFAVDDHGAPTSPD
jgi:hypothetical protein